MRTIETPYGPAIVVDLTKSTAPMVAPSGHGLVFWGRCDRPTLLACAAASSAAWMADYRPRDQAAEVFAAGVAGPVVGDRFKISLHL